jgi:hypothetical protein
METSIQTVKNITGIASTGTSGYNNINLFLLNKYQLFKKTQTPPSVRTPVQLQNKRTKSNYSKEKC